MKKKTETQPTFTGFFREGKGEYGFVDYIDDNGYEFFYFVHNLNRKNALNGDKVVFRLKDFRGKKEGQILKVIERSDNVLTGNFYFCHEGHKDCIPGYGFVTLDNKYFKNDVFLAGKDLRNLSDGDKVAVKIVKWTGKNPEGKLVEKLGKVGEKYVDLIAMAYEMGAREGFPKELIKKLEQLPKKINKSEFKNRKDLSNLFTFTIDPATAKDFDDAISIEKLENGNYLLYVHIADVTHYIPENSDLDKEAINRGTSIYFVDKVIPMLPEILSNELCSLNPNVDKLTMTCEMEIDSLGKVVNSQVYESIINSDFRLNYKRVEDAKISGFKNIDLDGKFSKLNIEKLLEKLKLSFELKDILYNYKKNNAYIEFDLIETNIVVDEHGFPIEIKEYEKYESHKVIELFMVVANEEVAKKYSKIPFLYRIHESPEDKDLTRIKFALGSIGITKYDKITDVIEKIKGHPAENYISKLILRSMKKAIYSPQNVGHYGLGLDYYSHFTSPIRRYPDLQIHRIIKEKNSGKLTKSRMDHYKEILPNIANLSSEKEQLVEDIEYKIDDYLKAKFMLDKIGMEFDGLISGVNEKGFFVQLPNTVEGFVNLGSNNLNNKNKSGNKKQKIDYDDLLLEIRNKSSGETFRLGDKVRIKVSNVDEKFSLIDFDLVKKL